MTGRTLTSGTTLLVASTGGHLEQLFRLKDRFIPAPERVRWVTFDDPQARSLLAGEQVDFVRYVAPRDYRAVLANVRAANTILSGGGIDRVISTGSGVALSFLATARLKRIACHYIESAARSAGPSLTGSLAARIPGVRVYSQYQNWANAQWQYRGSLFDRYLTDGPHPEPPELARRVVVTLGTMRTYGFRRALEAVVRTLPDVSAPDAVVLWQTGVTDATGLGIQARDKVAAAEMHDAIEAADLVIAHAGIGSALTALDLGKSPVLLTRRKHLGEHVDDHQLMIAGELDRRGLAVSRDPDDLTSADLRRAMAKRVSADDLARPFHFAG